LACARPTGKASNKRAICLPLDLSQCVLEMVICTEELLRQNQLALRCDAQAVFGVVVNDGSFLAAFRKQKLCVQGVRVNRRRSLADNTCGCGV